MIENNTQDGVIIGQSEPSAAQTISEDEPFVLAQKVNAPPLNAASLGLNFFAEDHTVEEMHGDTDFEDEAFYGPERDYGHLEEEDRESNSWSRVMLEEADAASNYGPDREAANQESAFNDPISDELSWADWEKVKKPKSSLMPMAASTRRTAITE